MQAINFAINGKRVTYLRLSSDAPYTYLFLVTVDGEKFQVRFQSTGQVLTENNPKEAIKRHADVIEEIRTRDVPPRVPLNADELFALVRHLKSEYLSKHEARPTKVKLTKLDENALYAGGHVLGDELNFKIVRGDAKPRDEIKTILDLETVWDQDITAVE